MVVNTPNNNNNEYEKSGQITSPLCVHHQCLDYFLAFLLLQRPGIVGIFNIYFCAHRNFTCTITDNMKEMQYKIKHIMLASLGG